MDLDSNRSDSDCPPLRLMRQSVGKKVDDCGHRSWEVLAVLLDSKDKMIGVESKCQKCGLLCRRNNVSQTFVFIRKDNND